MSDAVIHEMATHCNLGNPSASYKSAKRCQALMHNFRREIALLCKFENCEVAPHQPIQNNVESTILGNSSGATIDNVANIDPKQYYILFTSGASESNAMIISRVIDAYLLTGQQPHIVVSSIEHKSIIETIKYNETMGRCTSTFVNPAASGHILAGDVELAIRPNTALVCVMHANNEIGSINDIAAIAAAAHRHKVPFYSDAVQAFGKYAMWPVEMDVDGFSVSFHKMYGPVGCGLLILKRKWVEGYGIHPLIFGTQNFGMRGGTENIPAIAASRLALAHNMTNRQQKNKKLNNMKQFIIAQIRDRAPCRSYVQYCDINNITKSLPEIEIIFFDDSIFSNNANAKYLPNTIFLSIIKRSEPPMCNTKFKESLANGGIIISVGSACNTSSDKASHVLYALGADSLIRSGALRISLGDNNTKEDCIAFVKCFLTTLSNCVRQNAFKK